MLKMAPMFSSKISIEFQDSRSDVVKAAREEIVSTMVEQRNHFSNKIDDFHVLIDELKN